MSESWYDYVKPKYDKELKFCYMDRDCYIVYTKADDI